MKKQCVVWGSLACLASLLVTAVPAADAPGPAISNLPQVRVLATDPTALEGGSSGAFTVIRQGSTNADLAVGYALSGTASNGVDYVRLTNVVTLPAGLWAADVIVQPIDNGRIEKDKTVVLTLNPAGAYALGSARVATVTIVDDRFNDIPATVRLISPTNGTTFAMRTDVALLAEATDPDEAITKVTFFLDDHSLGSVTNPPYSLTWSNAAPGRHTLFALAKDALDESAISPLVKVTVSNTPPVVALTQPTNGMVFRVPTNLVLTATATDSDDAIQRISFYANGRFLHSVTNSPYTWTWTNVPPDRYQLVARATDVFGAATESAPVRITVSNTPPVVTLTSPTNGATFHVPTNITLRAEASGGGSPVQKVGFYSNGRLLHSVTNNPYTWTWTNAPPGSHILTARATDGFGAVRESAPVRIVVYNTPPKVTWVSPTNNTRFVTPPTVTLTATVTDPDDAVTKVSFYANDRLLGRFTNAPYNLVWTNPALGSYTLAAAAVDSYGAIGRATTRVLIDTNHPPSVHIASPGDLTTFHTRTNFAVAIEASDVDANVRSVELFVNGILLTSFASAAPSGHFVASWPNVAPGNYTLTATATDDLGLSSTSAPAHLIFATGALTPDAEASVISLLGQNPPTLVPQSVDPVDPLLPPLLQSGVQVGRTGPHTNQVERAHVEFAIPALPGGLFNATLVFRHGFNTRAGTFNLSSYSADLIVNTNDFGDATSPLAAFSTGPAIEPVHIFDVTELVQESAGANLGFQIKLPDELAVAGTLGLDAFFDFRILLASPSNLPPTVRILSPTNNAVFAPATNVAISVQAKDADGTVKSVEFFAGTNHLGTALLPVSPFPNRYRFAWTNAPAGSHDLTAVATDDQSARVTSPPVRITVSGLPQPPFRASTAAVPDALPVLEYVTELSNGGVQLTLTGPPGRRIAIETSSNFADWTPLTVVANPTGTVVYTDRTASSATRRFYRVKLTE